MKKIKKAPTYKRREQDLWGFGKPRVPRKNYANDTDKLIKTGIGLGFAAITLGAAASIFKDVFNKD